MTTLSSADWMAGRDPLPLLVGVVICWLLLSIVYRTSRNRPILFFTVPDADFVETARLRGLNRGQVVVAIRDGRLIIRPFFPFTLFFIPELLSVECDVPIRNVRGATIRNTWVGQRVRLTIENTDGVSFTVVLVLSEGQEFVRLLPHLRS